MSVPWCEYCQQYFSLDAYLEHCDVVDKGYCCVVEEEDGDLEEANTKDGD